MTDASRTDLLATFTRRAAGLAVDSLLVASPVLAVALLVAGDGVPVTAMAWLVLAQFASVVAYQTVGVARFGRTVGHRVCGVAVVRRSDGDRVTWAAAFRRAVVPAVAALVPVVGAALVAIVYVRAAFHPLRQGLHDAVADTVVVVR